MKVEFTCGCVKEQKDELLPDDAIVQQGIACQTHWRDQMDEQTKMYEQTNALPTISAGNVMQRKFAANLRDRKVSVPRRITPPTLINVPQVRLSRHVAPFELMARAPWSAHQCS